jgi:hypothetical protein
MDDYEIFCCQIGTLYVFVSEMKDGGVSKRDTTMTFTTFVMFDMFNALCCRHNSRPVFGYVCRLCDSRHSKCDSA